jgi:hypothetical protein
MTNEIKPKNIYQKIQRVRSELVSLNLKKSGKNTYSNFTYYELGDFLPALNQLMDVYGLATRFVIHPENDGQKERAVLEVFNSERPEDKIVYFSETASVEIGKKRDGTGGADPIQNLGGKITYMRRYLLMMAFEIVESDSVENQDKVKEKTQVDLDEESKKKILAATDLQELADVCKAIKEEKGPKYIREILNLYNARKEAIENDNS